MADDVFGDAIERTAGTASAPRDVVIEQLLDVPAQPGLEVGERVRTAVADQLTVTFDETATRARTARWIRRYIAALVSVDAAAALIAGFSAYIVRFNPARTNGYLVFTLTLPLLFVLSAFFHRAYETRYVAGGSEQFRRVFNGGVFLTALVAVVSFAFKLEVARGYIVIALPLATALAVLARVEAQDIINRMRASGRCLHRVVVIGSERSVAELVRQVRAHPDAGLTVVGACIDGARGRRVEGIPVVGGGYDGVAAVRGLRADTLAVTAWSFLSQQELHEVAWQLERDNVDLLVAPRLTGVAGPRISIRGLGPLPLLHVEQPRFTGPQRILKGTFDRLAASLLMLVSLPVFLAIAAAVAFTSEGPALFRQDRVGANGKHFTMYKFRTMVVDAEERLAELLENNKHQDGPLFKIDSDPRITGVGAWLRKLSLDELPQLLNVIKGDMSLVGPRPPLPREVAVYADDALRRLLVKPGITGLWQVSGRADLSWEESLGLDLHYVENWSFGSDLAILWRTIFAVLQRKGAY